MTRRIEAALPFWLDRPDAESVDIAVAAADAGLSGVWIGEMATYDAFALATAIGLRGPELRLNLGPLPISVRTPATLAFGASSVASLTGCEVNLSVGASSPAIVQGWHGRPWARSAERLRETLDCLRPMLRGERVDYDGTQVSSHGFRVRHPLPDARLGVGAFGPVVTRIAAQHADEIVLNMSTPERVAEIRADADRDAAAAGRPNPHITVWLPSAVDPSPGAIGQVSGQIAVYLTPPGYGEWFTELGYGGLVSAARAGIRRSELLGQLPVSLLQTIGAFGSPDEVTARIEAYLEMGADTVAVVPATADDPAGRRTLECAAGVSQGVLPARSPTGAHGSADTASVTDGRA